MATVRVEDATQDGPIYHLPVGPPPPRAVPLIAIILAATAAILGFLGRGHYAGVAALGSVAFGVYDLVRSLNTVSVSTSLIDREGNLNISKLERSARQK